MPWLGYYFNMKFKSKGRILSLPMINIFPVKIQLSQTMKKIKELDILKLNFYFYF